MTRYPWLCLIPMVIASPLAHAQGVQDKATAAQLFERARTHMEAERFAEACPLLEQSYELDPATGTQLNLAVCYEEVGRLASAWALYREVVSQDQRQGRDRRATFAQSRADAIEPLIPRLEIRVPEASRVPGLVVERAGQAVPTALYNVAVYVDAGTYEIAASAPGYRRKTTEIIAVDGTHVEVEITSLAPEPAPDDTQGAPADPVVTPKPVPEPTRPLGQDTGLKRTSPRRTIGLVAGLTGLASAGVGIGFGVSAWSSWQNAFDQGHCNRDTLLCDPQGLAMTDQARFRADLATILGGAGAALLVTGAILYVTAPNPSRSGSTRVGITPLYGPSRVGLTLSGQF